MSDLARFLTTEGVMLHISLSVHLADRFGACTAISKSIRFLEKFYGDVAFEEYP